MDAMTASRPPFLELSGCFRESFVQRCDPEVQNAVRLFGRLLEDLALERSLTEQGARIDLLIEVQGAATELAVLSQQLEMMSREAIENPLDDAELPLAAVVQTVSQKLLDHAVELAGALDLAKPPEPPTSPPARPRRRRSDRARPHLRPVPDLPPDEST